MDLSEKKPPPLEARAVGKTGIVIGTPEALDAREQERETAEKLPRPSLAVTMESDVHYVTMEFDVRNGDWLFTDSYGQVWRLRPTGDPSMPLTITKKSV